MSGNERRYSSWTGLYATGVGGRDVGGKDRDKDSSSDSKPVDVGSATGMTDPVDWDATAAACTRPKSRNDDNRPSGDTSLYYQAVRLISGIVVERSYERGLAKMREAALSGERGDVDWLVRKGPDGYDLVLDTDEDFVPCDHKLDVFVFRDTESAGGETAGMDVALRNIMNELEGERPRDPKKRLAKVAGKYASMLDVSMVDGRMHLEIKQNSHSFAANRKGVFIMITPACKDRTWDQVLRCYECRDIVEDVFMEDKSWGDGRRPRSSDRQTVTGRTFIRMVSMIMKMEIVNRISEYAKDRRVKTKDKPRNIDRQTPESLLSSLSTIEIVRPAGRS